jgi:hypothetical protein
MTDEKNKLSETSESNLNQKELAELSLLKEQKRSLRARLIFDIIKYTVVVVGAITLFLIIQQPESYLKLKTSEEEIQRERVKLVLELLKEKDSQKILLGLNAIKDVYPESKNKWLIKLKKTFISQTDFPIIEKALTDYTEGLEKNKNLNKQLNRLKNMLASQESSLPKIRMPPSVTRPGSSKPKFNKSPSVGSASAPAPIGFIELKPEEIRRKIRELETKIVLNDYNISLNKDILDARGVELLYTKDWEGKWYISWEADYQIYYEKETLKNPLTFEIKEGRLIGSYSFPTKNGIVHGEIRDIRVNQNCLEGKYYEKGSIERGNGTVEFLMFPGKKDAFIGRYKRIKSNFAHVDDYYKIWIGKRGL